MDFGFASDILYVHGVSEVVLVDFFITNSGEMMGDECDDVLVHETASG